MAAQTKSGKSLEYALAVAIYDKINNGQRVTIQKDSSYKNAKKSFESYSKIEQEKYSKAANSAVNHIVTLEPRLENPVNDEEIMISIQSDQKGTHGDVRDVLMVRAKNSWEVGFSAKNENNAVKHPRLSDKIDFAKQWLGLECSDEYMKGVSKIFGNARLLVKENKKKNHKLLWSEVPKKIEEYYVPLLEIFENEICSLIENNKNVASLLLEYMIGKNDFYKIMKYKAIVTIQGYNLHETLNIPSNSIMPQNKVPKLKFPARINHIERENDNKTIITFDKGWQISFRIHNASSKVEPSLKFDVRLVGVPPTLYSHNELW